MAIEIKSPREIEAIRVSSQMAAETLCLVAEMLRPGITTEEINTFVHQDTVRRGAIPSPLNYHGFPKSVCTSVNEVVCHGIPCDRILKDGDIINVDITSFYNGFHGDTSATFYIGEPSAEAKHVTEVARKSLELGIAEVKEGARLGDIGAAIQQFAEAQQCSVVRQFVGHGIGRKFHEPPQVAHYGTRGKGDRLRPGMVFTIEPMINLGGWEVEVLDDDWTAVTRDRKLSAQFEHTIAVTKSGFDILTKRFAPLKHSEIYPNFFPAS
ncbi:MAG: type I methionyl aminopeptidase [Sorangium cellulosum]|nr:MAG: type I methionyl aminopeptidase [Sorangium cellulosum]